VERVLLVRMPPIFHLEISSGVDQPEPYPQTHCIACVLKFNINYYNCNYIKKNRHVITEIHVLLKHHQTGLWVSVMVFNTTFNNISVISCRSVLLLEETGLPGENNRPVTSQTNFITKCYIKYTSPCYNKFKFQRTVEIYLPQPLRYKLFITAKILQSYYIMGLSLLSICRHNSFYAINIFI
jgi:hypothetical protein